MPTVPLLFGNVLDQPVDGVVGVGGFVGVLRVGEVHLRRELEDALRFEAAAQVLEDEDVAVRHQFLQTRRDRRGRLRWDAIRRARDQNRQRRFSDRPASGWRSADGRRRAWES